MLFGVITTIFPDAPAIGVVRQHVDDLVLVGDRKTPPAASSDIRLLSIDDQFAEFPEFAGLMPFNHYARKNIGYLHAIARGATILFDTDDDNAPTAQWKVPQPEIVGAISGKEFANIYRLYSDDTIWPRGLPLDHLQDAQNFTVEERRGSDAAVAVWQGLADLAPDVDAVWRMIYDKEFIFEKTPSPDHVVLDEGTFCPFNSQNTLWMDPSSFPFLYLPWTVTFRFTDILRGYVASFGIWRQGKRIGFGPATVEQARNPHSNFKDFLSEVPMYSLGRTVYDVLAKSNLNGGDSDLLVMYEDLARAGIVEKEELVSVERWINEIKRLCSTGQAVP
ncbi:hypothetical protein ABNQ39_35465 (plasmid) [Azospirillum sp. A26]|uniref:hypothetical protein n=1 Tax=Azospirillum sp. A26 TaxID=3160607 RepID=UPI003671BA54